MSDVFETGPIRPPSEAGSYLIRLTRGCPWNRCKFCRTYRRHKYEIRGTEEVIADIDAMARIRDKLLEEAGPDGTIRPRDRYEWGVANALNTGGRTAFLQDGDSLSMKPPEVRKVLTHLKERFPEVERITTYARSRTLANRKLDDLVSYRELGLTRIHIGMETAHNPLLEEIKKGVTYDVHVSAGKKVIEAGFELSEYVMPGLGGREHSLGHALDTARALSEINPHFIRLRTLCLGPKLELWEAFDTGRLTVMDDVETVEEIKTFISALDVTRTRLVSDHILNLLGDLEGDVATEKAMLLGKCDEFLALPAAEQRLYMAGRRAGLLESVADLDHPSLRARAQEVVRELLASYGEDDFARGVRGLMERFV
jgi:biotin synthase-like enzyme